jgi:hypothetical protein
MACHIAEWTNLWRFYHLVRGDIHVVSDKLHQKYGRIVCIGPDIVDVADPEVLKTAFNHTKRDWKKVGTGPTSMKIQYE